MREREHETYVSLRRCSKVWNIHNSLNALRGDIPALHCRRCRVLCIHNSSIEDAHSQEITKIALAALARAQWLLRSNLLAAAIPWQHANMPSCLKTFPCSLVTSLSKLLRNQWLKTGSKSKRQGTTWCTILQLSWTYAPNRPLSFQQFSWFSLFFLIIWTASSWDHNNTTVVYLCGLFRRSPPHMK